MSLAVISGDIIASTSLTDKGRAFVEKNLQILLDELGLKYNVYGRIIKGDYIECVIPNPENALRVALVIKTFLKSLSDDLINEIKDKRFKFFKIHAIRLAIGYGELSRFDPEKGVIDGEAIYLSGRKINEEGTFAKERIVIKSTLFFVSENEKLNKETDPLISLVDALLSKATAKQCEVIYLKLMGNNEQSIAAKLNIAQPVVNQHSTSAGWNAIEKAVNYFGEILKNK